LRKWTNFAKFSGVAQNFRSRYFLRDFVNIFAKMKNLTYLDHYNACMVHVVPLLFFFSQFCIFGG
jgi:hypothetical protein